MRKATLKVEKILCLNYNIQLTGGSLSDEYYEELEEKENTVTVTGPSKQWQR